MTTEKKKRGKEIMMKIVATNVVASRPPERRPTATPTARAKIMAEIVATTSLPVNRLTATDCNAAARANFPHSLNVPGHNTVENHKDQPPRLKVHIAPVTSIIQRKFCKIRNKIFKFSNFNFLALKFLSTAIFFLFLHC